MQDEMNYRGVLPARIQLRIQDVRGSELQFLVKKHTPMRKLMDAYCSRLGLQASQVRFETLIGCKPIAPVDTAEVLELDDEDLIFAFGDGEE